MRIMSARTISWPTPGDGRLYSCSLASLLPIRVRNPSVFNLLSSLQRRRSDVPVALQDQARDALGRAAHRPSSWWPHFSSAYPYQPTDHATSQSLTRSGSPLGSGTAIPLNHEATVTATVAVAVSPLPSLASTVSVYEDAVAESRAAATVICPVVVSRANLPSAFPAVSEYITVAPAVGLMAETTLTAWPTDASSNTVNAYDAGENVRTQAANGTGSPAHVVVVTPYSLTISLSPSSHGCDDMVHVHVLPLLVASAAFSSTSTEPSSAMKSSAWPVMSRLSVAVTRPPSQLIVPKVVVPDTDVPESAGSKNDSATTPAGAITVMPES